MQYWDHFKFTTCKAATGASTSAFHSLPYSEILGYLGAFVRARKSALVQFIAELYAFIWLCWVFPHKPFSSSRIQSRTPHCV